MMPTVMSPLVLVIVVEPDWRFSIFCRVTALDEVTSISPLLVVADSVPPVMLIGIPVALNPTCRTRGGRNEIVPRPAKPTLMMRVLPVATTIDAPVRSTVPP